MKQLITKVQAEHLKGRSFEHVLHPINIIVGDNDRGKTALVDAVRVGLLGYHPALGKTPGATMKLCKGTAMSTGVQINGDPMIHRQFSIKKGKVSATGPESEFPDMLFDLKPFWNLSAAARTDYLLGIMPSASVSPDAFIGATWPALPGQKELKAKVQTELRAAIKAEKLSDWTAEALKHVTERKRDNDASIRATQGFVSTQVQLQATDAEVENVRAELAKAETELIDINSRVRSLEAEESGNRDTAIMRRKLTEKSATAEVLESSLSDLRAKLNAIGTVVVPDRAPADERKAKAAVKAHSLKLNVETAEQRIGAIDMELDSVMQSDNCPHCGTSGDVWKPSIKAKFEADMRSWAEKLEQLQAELAVADIELTAADDELSVVLNTTAEAGRKLREADRLASEIRAAEFNMKDAREAKATLATLAPESPWSRAEEVVSLKARRSEAETNRAALREKQNQMIGVMQDAKRAMQAKERMDALEAEKEVYGELLKAVTAFREQAVESQIKELMLTVNVLAEGLLPSPIEYRDGEFGRFDGSQWVSLDVFGETYKTLANAGLCLALASTAPVKLVIIDELGRLDVTNKGKLLARVEKLIEEGTIDQFIGIDVADLPLYGCHRVIKV